MSSRPPVPSDLERSLMIEAGHRCAIPTCRAVGPLQIEHIVDWARVKVHNFENMIVLCANCHGRKGSRRGQIDPKSLRQYKENLGIINNRYGEFERRVLDHFSIVRPRIQGIIEEAKKSIATSAPALPTATLILEEIERREGANVANVEIPRGAGLLIQHLVQDGLLKHASGHPLETRIQGVVITQIFELTESGKDFVKRWKAAEPLHDLLT